MRQRSYVMVRPANLEFAALRHESQPMCSRYSLTTPPEAVREFFDLPSCDAFPPRYNIAPTQPVAIVRNTARATRELHLVRWGLIPSWVKDPRDFSTLINARSETAAEKPSFRGPMRHRRCLVPVSGFYEWTGKPGAKQPHLIAPAGSDSDTAVMAFAGLWDDWLGADGSEVETMAILTCAANGDVAAVHDRMPVILQPKDFDHWLDCRPGTAEGLDALLKPAADGFLSLRPVHKTLNNPRNDGPEVQRPPDRETLL